jgi:murein DD-endopeptidase MepM/ murein hydrolase activator NlpD
VRTVVVFLVLVLLILAPGPGRALAAEYPTAEEAIAAVVQLYEEEIDPAHELHVGALHSEGGWAYAVAQPIDGTTGRLLHELVPILARQMDAGWQALAPALTPAAEFNAWLSAVPASLMDGSLKAFLQQPGATAASLAATFGGHYLPWPGGRFATVSRRDGVGHAGQIDFVVDQPVEYGDDSVYSTKAGTVVFIKESSPNPVEICEAFDDCWRRANVVVIQHGPEEYSWYVHLAHNSVPDNLYIGMPIPAGVKVGVQGQTGWTTGEHLHYMVSTGHYPWTDPGDPDALTWATGIAATDFVERSWDALFSQEVYLSANYGQQIPQRRSVDGLVRDGYGRAAGGAVVALLRADGLGEERLAASDGLGTYKFQQVDDGLYVVGAGVDGRWQMAAVTASGTAGVEAPSLLLTRSCGSATLALDREVEALVCAGSAGAAAPLGAAAIAPLVLRAQSGVNNVYLEWEPTNSSTISQYRLLRAIGESTVFTPLATTTESVYFDPSTIARGTRACYRVQAQRADGALIAESNTDCVLAQTVSLWVPNVEARPGEQVMVPVNIRNARGLRLGSTDIWLDYNPRLLALRAVTAGTLARDYAWVTSVSSQGELSRVRVSSASTLAPALYGSGALFWLTFDVLPADVMGSPLDLRDYVDGAGGSTIVPLYSAGPAALALLDGAFYAEPVQAYGRGDLDGNGLVDSADGALAVRLASGGPGTSRQVRAADLTGDGRVDAADGSALLAYAAEGSWPITSAPAALAGTASLANTTSILGGRAVTRLSVSGAGAWAGGTFWLAYDPALVAGVIDATPVGIAAGRQIAFYDEGAGLARIVLGGAGPVTGNGPVAEIGLRVGGTVSSGTSTPLVLVDTALHDAAGQDYATSSLQLVTARVSSTLQVNYLATFLPRIGR